MAGQVSSVCGTGVAPTNDAFAALLAELGVSKDELWADVPLLTRVLTYHVMSGRVLKAEVPVGPAIATVEGGTFTVAASLSSSDQRGRSAGIVATDVLAGHGAIHVIDSVVLPK